MLFYKKILFPVDLSEASPKIALHVNEVADKFSSQVYIIFVFDVLRLYAIRPPAVSALNVGYCFRQTNVKKIHSTLSYMTRRIIPSISSSGPIFMYSLHRSL